MTELEDDLSVRLPRPVLDTADRERIWARVTMLIDGTGPEDLDAILISESGRRIIVYVGYVGGAVVGAAAIAVGAAFGWRRLKIPRTERAA